MCLKRVLSLLKVPFNTQRSRPDLFHCLFLTAKPYHESTLQILMLYNPKFRLQNHISIISGFILKEVIQISTFILKKMDLTIQKRS